jgi:uncharacterized protein (TIGR00299 family) protein
MMKKSHWSDSGCRSSSGFPEGVYPPGHARDRPRSTASKGDGFLMRIAYLDCFSGISGDMFLGALVDAGVPLGLLAETVAALNVGARIEVSRVNRSGISASKADVSIEGQKDRPRENWGQDTGNHHPPEQQPHDQLGEHRHEHGAKPVQLAEHNYGLAAKTPEGLRQSEPSWASSTPPRPNDAPGHSHRHEQTRGLREVRQIISSAAISEAAKRTAILIFEALGASEAKIHNVDLEKVHFHEVGAVDALVDIVCAAVGAEALGVEEIVCSPLNVGGGTVKCAHGTFPVPAPATLDLLTGAPVYSSGIQAELVTPTGAAIVRTLVKRFAQFPAMKVDKIGYGAGSRDFPGHANVVRLTIGEQEERPEANLPARNGAQDTIAVLEANIDDLNPQIFAYAVDRALEEGALDAFGIPVQMKKNRPGMLLTLLCKPGDAARLAQLLFTETSTLGVRHREERRQILARKFVTVNTRWGDVRLKVASMNGAITHYAPEYEDCRRIAAEHRIPLKSVMQEALQQYVQAAECTRAEALSK